MSHVHDRLDRIEQSLAALRARSEGEPGFAGLVDALDRVAGDLRKLAGPHRPGDDPSGDAALRAVLATAIEGVIIIDSDGRVESFNPAAEKIFGYDAAQIIGRPVNVLMPPPDSDRHGEYIARYLATGKAGIIGTGREVKGRHEDGRILTLELGITESPYGDSTRFIGFVRDISARKAAEEALRRSEETLRVLYEMTTFGDADFDARTAALLRVACERFELPLGTLTRVHGDECITVCQHAAAGHAAAGQEELPSTRVSAGSLCSLTLDDGDVVHFESLADAPAELARAARDARAAGSPLVETYFGVAVRSGDRLWGTLSFRGLEPRGRTFTPSEVETIKLIAQSIGGEILRRETAEVLAQTQAQLLQAQKMEAVGRLAGGIAHDFGNLLMGVSGCAKLAASKLTSASPAAVYVEEIAAAADRGTNLTRQLMTFSRKQRVSPRHMSLNDVVRSAEGMLRQLVRDGVRLEVRLCDSPTSIRADPGQVEQVLMNLVVNARDAITDEGVVTVATEELGPGDSWEPGWVKLSVRDTGIGMDDETRAHAFEPFFTTKGAGQGTGLGLATVYGIVTQYSGRIEVTSAVGEGTELEIYFRREKPHENAEPERAAPPDDVGGAATVLLVEDERLVRMSVRHFLEELGYRVVEAALPDEALRLLSGPATHASILLTDMKLPGMNGRELAAAVSQQRPGVRILYMSAHPRDILERQGLLTGDLVLLQKPFGVDALAAALRSA